MARSKLAPVYALLLALTLFLAGMLSYRLLAGAGTTGRAAGAAASKPAAQSDKLGIAGKVAIQIYSPSGKLVNTWKGHNSLVPESRNGIAMCMSGRTTTPSPFGTCSGWTTTIQVIVVGLNAGYYAFYGDATNSLMPAGCDAPSAQWMSCNGWQVQATVNISVDGTLNGARATNGSSGSIGTFDAVNVTDTAVKAGDRAVITITFTVGA